MKRLLTGFLLSFTEDGRLSPRLVTVFAFVTAALLLLWRGATTPPTVEAGVILTAWPPEYIWSGVCLIIAGLLGLGKVTDALVTRTRIQATAAVDTAVAVGAAPPAPATATTQTTTTLGTD